MYSFLLVIIYMAFISLGLPDSLVGSAWPVMHTELNVPVSYAGMITMVIAAGTVISSLLSDRLTKKLGAGLVTAVSVLMTAASPAMVSSFCARLWVRCRIPSIPMLLLLQARSPRCERSSTSGSSNDW